MYGVIWLCAIIVFLLLEAATYQFICIWFAGGALAALGAFELGASLNIQLFTFFVASAVLLVLTRPLVRKINSERKIKTNVEELIGQLAQVTEKIDNIAGMGKVKLGGMEWTARSSDGTVIDENVTVEVVEVSGVKLMVKLKENERTGD